MLLRIASFVVATAAAGTPMPVKPKLLNLQPQTSQAAQAPASPAETLLKNPKAAPSKVPPAIKNVGLPHQRAVDNLYPEGSLSGSQQQLRNQMLHPSNSHPGK